MLYDVMNFFLTVTLPIGLLVMAYTLLGAYLLEKFMGDDEAEKLGPLGCMVAILLWPIYVYNRRKGH